MVKDVLMSKNRTGYRDVSVKKCFGYRDPTVVPPALNQVDRTYTCFTAQLGQLLDYSPAAFLTRWNTLLAVWTMLSLSSNFLFLFLTIYFSLFSALS